MRFAIMTSLWSHTRVPVLSVLGPTLNLSKNRGNFNRYTKRPLQDSAIIFSTPGMGESAFYCANHRVSCKCQQPPGWKIHRFFRWKMPFAVFRSGSGVSERTPVFFPVSTRALGRQHYQNHEEWPQKSPMATDRNYSASNRLKKRLIGD